MINLNFRKDAEKNIRTNAICLAVGGATDNINELLGIVGLFLHFECNILYLHMI